VPPLFLFFLFSFFFFLPLPFFLLTHGRRIDASHVGRNDVGGEPSFVIHERDTAHDPHAAFADLLWRATASAIDSNDIVPGSWVAAERKGGPRRSPRGHPASSIEIALARSPYFDHCQSAVFLFFLFLVTRRVQPTAVRSSALRTSFSHLFILISPADGWTWAGSRSSCFVTPRLMTRGRFSRGMPLQ